MQITRAGLAGLVQTSIGRHDDYALQRDNGLYARVGRRLTQEALRLHLAGVQTIGSYLIDEHGCCRFAVFDADDDAGLLALLDVQAALSRDGMVSYLEGSRRGAHLRVLLSAPTPAPVVRRVLRPYCPAGIEFYPKQDEASWQHPGSLVRVPLGVHRVSGRRYPFLSLSAGRLVPVSRSLSDSLTWLSSVERVRLPEPQRVGEAVQRELPAPHKKYPSKPPVVRRPSSSQMSIREWCMQQNPLAVIGRYVALDQRGMGCCPFGWHHRAGRDRRPSLRVYRPAGKEVCCWWCHTWQQGGSLFDFLRLYHGLDARQLWHRLLAGEVF